MSVVERIKRPKPERTDPIRTWEGFLGALPTGVGGAAAPPKEADDVFARSVELGYRVVDEYVTRGQEAAQRMRRGTYGAADVTRDVQGVAEQLVRSASDFVGAWVEFFALADREGRPAEPSTRAEANSGTRTPADHGSHSTGDAPEVPLRVRLRVDTVRPVDAMLEISNVVAGQVLVVHQLRLANGLGRIDGVCVEPSADGGVVLRVTIPSNQPPGRYAGSVVDDRTNLPVGEITVGID